MQALRDTSLRCGAPGSKLSPEDKKDWLVKVHAFLRSEHDEVCDVQVPAKIRRVAAYYDLQAMDNMLRVVLPNGLLTFLPPKIGSVAPAAALKDLHTLVYNSDAGPVPWCARSFRMYHLKLREIPQRDFYHMIWRILMNAAKDSG